MTLLDLTQRYRQGMFSQHLFPPVRVERCIELEERGVNVTCIEVCVHHGTHIDAPRHFLPDGRTIDEVPLDGVCGPAVGLSIRGAPGSEITVRDLEAQDVEVRPGDIVVIHTGWGQHFSGDPERYQVHPYLGLEAAEWLRSRQIKLVGLDVPTPDLPEPLRPAGFNWPVHHLLLRANILIGEHFANLESVAGRRFKMYAFPIPIEGADGSPVRVVAEITP